MSVNWHSGVWRIAVECPAHASLAFEKLIAGGAEAVSAMEVDDSGTRILIEGTTTRPPDRTSLLIALEILAQAYAIPLPTLEIEPLPPTDWLSWSLVGFPPILAGRFFIHGSHFEGPPPKGRLALRIDAAMAFGTGEHGSTRGCLLALSDQARQPIRGRILDLGCGSAILAIAAIKLFKKPVLAVDIDPISVSQARINGRRNRCGQSLDARIGNGFGASPARSCGPYALIFANILARPLAQMAPALAARLRPGGRVILSGLLVRQEGLVRSALQAQGLSLVQRYTIGDWRTLVMTKRARPHCRDTPTINM